MPVTISIPAPLRQFADGKSQIVVEAKTAGEALERLTSTYISLRRHLFNEQNVLRNFVNVYLNDEDIRHASGPETPVKDGDTIMIVPSIAGGAVVESEVAQSLPELSNEEILRYSRHLIMPEVGMQGQRKLKAASVLMIGTGGLGAPVGMYLAAAGVGRIGVVDFDVVEESNLQRQVIHGTKDLGRRKIESARDRMRDINPHIEIETHETRLTSHNAMQLFRNYDVVVDGTDNFPKGACYRCLYPEPPPPGLVPSCAEGGVLGVLPGIVGAIQANETIKIILGAEDLLINRLLLFDAWSMKFREFKLRKDPKCPVCGEEPTVKELIDYEQFCGITSQHAAPPEPKLEEITATELNARRLRGDRMQIIDVREPHEFDIAKIPGTKLIPLNHVVTRMNEIDPEVETIVHCKGGVRSAKAIQALKRAGFSGRLINLKGGITAWSEDVDPRVAKY
jgi:molybdopterin/thiamine biosynthesis adenylyltransferase/rhodanese-related sulfurtransferase/molybdopterin converting factor small subunit